MNDIDTIHKFFLLVDQEKYDFMNDLFTKSCKITFDDQLFSLEEFMEWFRVHKTKNRTVLHFCFNDTFETKEECKSHQGYVNRLIEGRIVSTFYCEDLLDSSHKFLERKMKTIFINEKKIDIFSSKLTKISWKNHEALKDRPKRIILVRHGESEANINPILYSTTPESLHHLTENGRSQAREAGKRIKKILGDEPVFFYYSPFQRTKETLEEVAKEFGGIQNIHKRVEPRLREQEWGNFQKPELMKKILEDRKKIGSFLYRFPNGESGADVCDR